MDVEYFIEATADDGTVTTHGPYATEDACMLAMFQLKQKGLYCKWYPEPKTGEQP